MNVVADTNVVVSAIFWPGEFRQCLALWARRRFHLAVTIDVLEEYREIAHRLAVEFPQEAMNRHCTEHATAAFPPPAPGELGSLSATLHRRLEQLSNSCPTFEAPRTNSP